VAATTPSSPAPLPDPPGAGPGGGDGDELAAVEAAWATALLSNDADGIARFMTEDWVVVSDSGITSRERFLAVIRSGLLTHSAMRPADEGRIRVYGDTAVCTFRVGSTAQFGGRSRDADEWVTDVFVRRDGEWRCALTHLTAADPAA
jgi:uncharacterized protein (TIGR02246 family)